jgi:tRNA-splicing ligase RtcB
MQALQAVKQSQWMFEIPRSARADMRVPARVYADATLWEQISHDRSIEQLINVATLPGVTGYVCAMPDVHQGYGFPVGGVAATRVSDGVISPGGVGYDINCGVRLLTTDLMADEARPRLETAVHDLSRTIPSGPGRNPRLSLEPTDMDRVLVSAKAKKRGHDQLGTIGSGNHFVEVQRVEQVFNEDAATAFGLAPGRITVLIHTGSRGLGHQICTDYVRLMDEVMARYDIRLPDRQLASAPLSSPEGARYFGAMCAAANFAWANRQAITESVRSVFERVYGDAGRPRLVYDVAHNIAKIETYNDQKLCVHRKGATRAFGPASPETPVQYRAHGQPVFIPGSMGTASYVLAGADTSGDRSFGSCCHGAGRAMSRGAAKRAVTGAQVRRQLEGRGIVVRCASKSGLAEEAQLAYKDVDRVVDVVHRAGLARRVARLVPVGVIKG